MLLRDVKRKSPAAFSGRLDVLGSRSLRSLPFRVGNSLAFLELFETDSLEVRRVEEQVIVGTGVNESETPVRQTLDRAFSHLSIALKSVLPRGPRKPWPNRYNAPDYSWYLSDGI